MEEAEEEKKTTRMFFVSVRCWEAINVTYIYKTCSNCIDLATGHGPRFRCSLLFAWVECTIRKKKKKQQKQKWCKHIVTVWKYCTRELQSEGGGGRLRIYGKTVQMMQQCSCFFLHNIAPKPLFIVWMTHPKSIPSRYRKKKLAFNEENNKQNLQKKGTKRETRRNCKAQSETRCENDRTKDSI